jgi:hypothetical protein
VAQVEKKPLTWVRDHHGLLQAGLYNLLGTGPKYLRVIIVHRDRDTGELKEKWEAKVEKSEELIIEGHHPDLVERVQEAQRNYEEAHRKWDADCERTVRDAQSAAREKYYRDCPRPVRPTPRELMGDLWPGEQQKLEVR